MSGPLMLPIDVAILLILLVIGLVLFNAVNRPPRE
jgi:hypothetical protein